MRLKRLMLNKRNRARTIFILLLFILILPALSIYLSNQLMYRIVTPLYKRLEPVSTDTIESYEVGPLIYYGIYLDIPDASINLYSLNDDGLIACLLSKDDAMAIINMSGNGEMVVKEQRIGGTTVHFVKNNRDKIESINNCIKNITLVIQKESNLSAIIFEGKNGQEEVLRGIKEINNVLKEIDTKNNTMDVIDEFIRIQDDALDRLEISDMLNDGKSFYIIQDAIYKSLDLYNKMVFRLEEIELYNF